MVAARALPSKICAVICTLSVDRWSVEEVSRASEIHGCSGRLDGGYDVLVTDRAAGLHDGRYTCGEQDLGAIGGRKEGIGGSDRTRSTVASPLHRQPAGVNPIHLPHSDADGRTGARKED